MRAIKLSTLLFLLVVVSCYAFVPMKREVHYVNGVETSLYSSQMTADAKLSKVQKRNMDWFNESLKYYNTIRRLEHCANGFSKEEEEELFRQAGLHYFALMKIRNKENMQAERAYRGFIKSILNDRQRHGECDHESLAVTTLLLALHIQRKGPSPETTREARAVFTEFFRIVGQDEITRCSCSAKVLQAFALFEMKNGSPKKSYKLVLKAVAMDESLAPVLRWKKFKEVAMAP